MDKYAPKWRHGSEADVEEALRSWLSEARASLLKLIAAHYRFNTVGTIHYHDSKQLPIVSKPRLKRKRCRECGVNWADTNGLCPGCEAYAEHQR
jgi:rubrerythrin